jgi:hypothetical protein
MKIIEYIRQPQGTGIALFIAAATVCLAIIVTGQLGLATTAQVLSNIAQPICACAIGVLMYLGIVARKLEAATALSDD